MLAMRSIDEIARRRQRLSRKNHKCIDFVKSSMQLNEELSGVPVRQQGQRGLKSLTGAVETAVC